LATMPAEGLSSLGSLSGGVCGAAAALALLSASAAAEGAVALAAAALAAVAAALAAVAATCKACTSTGGRSFRLVVSAEFSARAVLLATACALSAAKRLRGVVLPGLPVRLAPRLLFLLGSRQTIAQRRLDASVLASSRRDARRGGR
jgi:hypothetical protein